MAGLKCYKITVLFLIDCLVSADGLMGGTERQILEIFKRVDEEKINIVLCCLRNQIPPDLVTGKEQNCFVLNAHSFKSISVLRAFYSFYMLLRKNKADIVQSFFFDSTLFGTLVAKVAGVKNIVSSRRDLGFWYTPSLLKRLKIVNRLTDRVLVNSEAVKESVVQREGVDAGKIDVLYNGIDLNKFELTEAVDLTKLYNGVDSSKKIVCLVANFNRRVKRLDLFIQAMPIILNRMQNVRFIVIGEGSLKDELSQLAKRLGVEEQLIWAGRQNDPASFLKASDIGILTSDSEGFPNAILEYMAAGLPVVSTDGGGCRELVQDGLTGFLVPIGNAEGLAVKILILLQNPALAKKMGKRGQKIIKERYDWKVKIKEVEKYYRSLVEGKA